jgi:hypothetical protein
MWENLFLFYGSDHVDIFPSSPLLQQQHLQVSPNKFGGRKKSYYFHMLKQYLRQRAGKNDKFPIPERIW